MSFHPMPRCPRCGKIGKIYDEKVKINEWESIHFTHICTDEKCNTPFRYEPPPEKIYKAFVLGSFDPNNGHGAGDGFPGQDFPSRK